MTKISTLDGNAATLISDAFRVGTEQPDFSGYEGVVKLAHPIDLEAVRTVVDEAMRRFNRTQGTDADVWLAPRLHYTLRLTRREAARRDIWRWLGVVFASEYVRWRFGSPDAGSNDPEAAAPRERFDGPDYKHALGRLWWMAELFRNGPDYSPVTKALLNQDIPNNLFRMDVAHHRPTVQAAIRVLDGRTGREANALAKAANAAATTLVIDTIGPDDPLDAEAVRAWVDETDLDPGRYFDELPPGPRDPQAATTSTATLTTLLGELFAEAPIRGRKA
jgi:hypothetical protein